MRNARWAAAVVAGALVGMLAVVAASCASSADDTARASAAAPPSTDEPGNTDEGNDTVTRTITVTGEGKVTVEPDTAHVQMGVQVSGESAQEVLAQTNERAAALIEALKALGVAERDIATNGLSIYPQYSPNGSTVTGYTASNNLTVTIREIARAGEIIDGGAAFAGESITIGGIWFSVADPESVMAEARAAAIESAKKRAGEYAAAADAEVGAVVTISENGGSMPIPFDRSVAMEAAADASMPVMAGTTDLTASVTVVFELV
jgi:uncharacterized protein